MDISETYIHQCDCPEIQGLWKPVKGDLVARPSTFDGYGNILGHSADSIVITFMGENEHDCRWNKEDLGKVLCYYTRNWLDRTTEFNLSNPQNVWFYWHDKKDYIWLPRQGQLQAMVDGGFTHQNLERFYQWYRSGINQHLSSMEQLWLAFVMKENNKVWDEDKWVSI